MEMYVALADLTAADLFGREARCPCGKLEPSSAMLDSAEEGRIGGRLAFFEYRGEGSRAAALHCRHCRYYEVAHGEKPCDGCDGTGTSPWLPRCPRCGGSGVRANKAIMRDPDTNLTVPCPGFEPHGAFEYDLYYCGHSGWD